MNLPKFPSLAALLILATGIAGTYPCIAGTESAPVAIFKNLEAGKNQTVVVYGTSLAFGGKWATATKE